MNYSQGLSRVSTILAIGCGLANFIYATQEGVVYSWSYISSGIYILKYFGCLLVNIGLGSVLSPFCFLFIHTLLITIFSRAALYLIKEAILWAIAGFKELNHRKEAVK